MSHNYIFDTRGPETYNQDINQAIDIITLDPSQKPTIVGSFQYRVHKYPSDIDMLEYYQICCDIPTAKKQIVKRFKQMAQRIKNNPKVYLSDFKSGKDTRFDIFIGDKQNNTIIDYNYDDIIQQFNSLFEKKLLTNTQMNNLLTLLHKDPTIKQWEELHEALRMLYTVRWSINELLNGKKVLPGNKTFLLADAVTQQTITKIDIFIKLNNRFTEVTNFFIITLKSNDNELTYLSQEFPDYRESLITDIKQRFKESKYLKLSKRLWLLYVYDNNISKLKLLYPLFSSPGAIFYQLSADAEVLRLMIEKIPKPPMKDIYHQLSSYKLRLTEIPSYVLSDSMRQTLYDMVDIIIYSDTKQERIDNFQQFEKTLLKLANTYAKSYLENAGLCSI